MLSITFLGGEGIKSISTTNPVPVRVDTSSPEGNKTVYGEETGNFKATTDHVTNKQ